ncbi:MAG: ABC transporter ATP-binding protein [Clostridia bacterium]|nr:ABC transporter ATP-binding protein [Clostridia bacterium]
MLLGKYINRYYLRYWFFFLIGILSLVAVDLAQLFQPEFLGQIVDHLDLVSKGAPLDTAMISDICLKILLIAGVMFLGRMLWRYTLFNASQRIEAGLRHQMFLKSERLSQRYYHETKVGSIMSWFTTDLETIEEYTGFGTVQMVDAFFLGVLVLIKMFSLDWVMTLFALIPMIFIIIWGALVEKYMALKWEERQKAYDSLYDFTQENFTGIRVIKAFVKETSELHAFAKVARKNKDANISFVRVAVGFDVVIEIIIALILCMIIGFGAWFVYAFTTEAPIVIFGHPIALSAGSLITFIGYFDTLIWPLIAMGSLVTMFSRARTSLKRVNAYLDIEEEIHDNPDDEVLSGVSGKIEFRHCSFSYPVKKPREILHDVSFTVEPGETIGVVGRIGSGKSTLMTLLTRLYNLPEDTILIDGKDIMKCTIASVREQIAFVPQDNFLFSASVSDNISFSKEDASPEEIRQAAVFADVAENIEEFDQGYDTVTGERGVTLSGGQKQRIAIARAFLKDAPIMIFDDSVSAVDVKTEETILNHIREMRKGKTTLIVASRVSTVSRLSRVLVLNEGSVEAFDSPERLMEISPTYKKMVVLQELEKEVEGGGRS